MVNKIDCGLPPTRIGQRFPPEYLGHTGRKYRLTFHRDRCLLIKFQFLVYC